MIGELQQRAREGTLLEEWAKLKRRTRRFLPLKWSGGSNLDYGIVGKRRMNSSTW